MARGLQLAAGALAAAMAVLAGGCGSPPPPAPSAVIVADPPAVCAGDGFQTVVRLHARDSQSRLTLVPDPPDPGDPPLALTWSFSGAAHRIVEGDVHAVELAVTTAGDRPFHVMLDVKNADGGEATALLTVPLTIPEGDAGCAAPPPEESE